MSSIKHHITETVKLGVPVMITQLSYMLVGLSDTWALGQISSVDLAASALGVAISTIFFVFGLGFSIGLTPLVAQARGEGDDSAIKNYFEHSVYLNIVVGLVLAMVAFAAPLVQYMNQPPDVSAKTAVFIQWLLVSLLPLMIFQSFKQFAEGMGDTQGAMAVVIGGCLLNVVFLWVLVPGHSWMPAYGLNGAGFSTLAARTIMMIAMAIYVLRRRRYSRYWFIPRLSGHQLSCYKTLIDMGLPISMQMVYEAGAFSAAGIIMGTINATTLAAHQIALSLAATTFMISLGLASAVSVRVAHFLGAKEFSAMRTAGKTGLVMVTLQSVLFGVLFWLLGPWLASQFSHEVPVVALASNLLMIAALFQISDGVQAMGIAALRGLGDVDIPSRVALVSYWVISLPIGYLLAFPFGMGAYGVWIGLSLGLGVAAVVATLRFLKLSKDGEKLVPAMEKLQMMAH